MTEHAPDNMNASAENADNMAQNTEPNDELLSQEMDELAAEITEETEKIRAELEESKDKYLRIAAEFDNFRRRNAKERIELVQTAGREVLQSLLVVLDDCDRATKQIETETDIEKLKEGVSLVFNKLRNTLQQRGLRIMDSLHQPFDPDLHEAITEIPAPSKDLVGKVLDVVEPGYYLNDKLIRHAKVVVGK